jgi:hypothetical protein
MSMKREALIGHEPPPRLEQREGAVCEVHNEAHRRVQDGGNMAVTTTIRTSARVDH